MAIAILMEKSGAYFFDLDGTLADPLISVEASVAYAFCQAGLPAPGLEKVKLRIGPPMHESIPLWLPDDFRGDQANAVRKILHDYREHQAAEGIAKYKIYSGTKDILAAASAKNKVYLATSKLEKLAAQVLAHLGIEGYFTGVYGSQEDGRNSDKKDLIAFALADSKAQAKNSIMIGDRLYDVQGAIANGVNCWGVAWGYAQPGELQAVGAARIFTNFNDLVLEISKA